jgi:hypothetical protein
MPKPKAEKPKPKAPVRREPKEDVNQAAFRVVAAFTKGK